MDEKQIRTQIKFQIQIKTQNKISNPNQNPTFVISHLNQKLNRNPRSKKGGDVRTNLKP